MPDAEQLAVENRVLEQIVRGAPLGEVLATLCLRIEALVPGALCAIQLLDSEGGRLVGGAAPSLPPAYREACEGLTPAERVACEDIAGLAPRPAHLAVALDSGLRACWSMPLRDEGEVVGACTIHHRKPGVPGDGERRVVERLAGLAGLAVRQRSVLRRLLAANRSASMGPLAAGVAHEINNPLAFLRSNLVFLRARLGDLGTPAGSKSVVRDLDEALADCAEGARRIEVIVRDLRVFSDGDDRPLGPVDVKRVLELAVRMVFNEVCQRARLRRDFEQAPAALGDAGRLVQVVVDLLVQAAQALPEGSSEEYEVVLAAREEGEEVVIEVRDNGPGRTAEDLACLVDPPLTARPASPGDVGLGLAVSRGVVDAMHGRLRVDSQPGQGSRFQVRLPRAPEAPGAED